MNQSSLGNIITITFDLMRTIRHHLTSHSKEKAPVNFLQMHALALVSLRPGITMKELADNMKVASPSATSFVNRLVKLSWVERKHDAKNRKLVRLWLTREGTKVLHDRKNRNISHFKKILNALTKTEQRQLAHLLQKLLTASADSR